MYVIKKNDNFYEMIWYQTKGSDILADPDRTRLYTLESAMRAKRTIIDYANNNNFNYFVTITFDRKKVDRYNYVELKRLVIKYFNNFNQRKDKEFKYLLVPEFHKLKKGETIPALHFHALCRRDNKDDLHLIKQTDDTSIFRDKYFTKKFGKMNEWTLIYNSTEFIGNYISKYITKGIDNLILDQYYYSSNGLKKSEEIFRTKILWETREPDYSNKFCKKWKLDLEEATQLIMDNS